MAAARKTFESLTPDDVAKFVAWYRPGLKTDRQIAVEFGVSHTTIQKWADKLGIERDLSGRIRDKADAKVARDAVAKEVAKTTLATEREIVEANAELQARIIREHRTDITAMRAKANEYRIELDSCGEDLGKRTSILKMLMEVQKSAIGLERQAFGIADNSDGDKPADTIDEIVRRVVKAHD